MKNGKLIFLLAAILSLTVFLVACGGKNNDDPNDSADTSQEGVNQGEQEIQHEIRDYFIVDNGTDAKLPAEISKFEGEVVDVDSEHNLMAIKTKDLNTKNEVVQTVTVYDVLTGEKMLEHSVANLLDETRPHELTSLSVDVNYPVIRISEWSYSEDSGAAIYENSYYLAKKGSEALKKTDLDSYAVNNHNNRLYECKFGDEIFWIDSEMNVIRTVNAIAAAGYSPNFDYEYKGYLYSWSEKDLLVFNRNGELSGKYSVVHDGMINVHVLNDGNVLVQDVEYVKDEFALYDALIGTNHCNIKSFIMNMVDGKLTEVELDFIVDDLESAYAYDEKTSSFPMQLAEGRENQAIVYRYANGAVARTPIYVVLNNKLEIEYTLKNDTVGFDVFTIDILNCNYYTARVYEGTVSQRWIFDLDGKKIDLFADGAVTENYIVTENAIYDHKMNVVYDIKGGDFSGCLTTVDEDFERIYFSKHNYVTGGDEAYVYDAKEKKPVLLIDGVDTAFLGAEDGIYATFDVNTNTQTIYNAEGKALVVVSGLDGTFETKDAMIIPAEIEGKHVLYVVK